MYVQLGQILDPKDRKSSKTPTATFGKAWSKNSMSEQKQGTAHAPAHNTTLGVDKTPEPHLCPEPVGTPLPSSHIRNRLMGEQASKGNYWLFSLPAARAGTPIKPFLNFLSGL